MLFRSATSRGSSIDASAIDEAATLAKTDLTTELVKEFTELQGIIGGLYARSQGFSATVADSIYDQYLPVSAKDAIPRSPEGCVLGLADRIDTIAGMFALGMEPTGSKDPFALRRAANAIVKILAESTLPLTLSDVLAAVPPSQEVSAKLHAFFTERIAFYLREGRDQAYDVVKAVMAAGADDLHDLIARSEAVTAIRGSADFLAVCAAFKRIKNILAQATDHDDEISSFEPRFDAEEEANTWVQIQNAGAGYSDDCKNRHYIEALRKLAGLRPVIDQYFNSTRVMADDLEVRANRLGMVRDLVIAFAQIADFSEIVTAG